jgi:hypothetical protein
MDFLQSKKVFAAPLEKFDSLGSMARVKLNLCLHVARLVPN